MRGIFHKGGEIFHRGREIFFSLEVNCFTQISPGFCTA